MGRNPVTFIADSCEGAHSRIRPPNPYTSIRGSNPKETLSSSIPRQILLSALFQETTPG